MAADQHGDSGEGAALRIALDQSAGPSRDPDGALGSLERSAAAAAERGAHLLVTPEMSLTGYNIGEASSAFAEPADGPLAGSVARIAARQGIAILHGYPEREGQAVHNTAQLTDAAGNTRAGYRKTHLFGPADRGVFTPGDAGLVQTELNGLRLGILICYDVEFPEMVRRHALAGTDLLLVPTALMHPHTAVATSVVPVRALENQIHVAYVNRCDTEGELDYCGLSCLVDPWGEELLRAGSGPELLLGEVDRRTITAARRSVSYLADRRPELYTPLAYREAAPGTTTGDTSR
ncbi:putative amidohydrolase [Haloactinospora alba]|uniref:Putative amidohydrolase n=1 Tax=Haloactinospora alba TaxID=405555 RepID=A0A543NGE6_9ACTN|nr:carbon-nitrogen hydrolase family protein [Haloactinospora alba]TQN30882.1 putative amidohydrolase [Haloactinospora alba]